jgi:hypothetical protein
MAAIWQHFINTGMRRCKAFTVRSYGRNVLSKIANLLKRAALVSGVTGALVIGATATAQAAVPAAQAPAAVSSTDMSHAAQNAGPITPQSHSDCTNYLQTWGYEVTNKRNTICALASFPFPSQHLRIVTCTGALLATGVGGVVAPIACTLATAP